jgi:hypothetical protein
MYRFAGSAATRNGRLVLGAFALGLWLAPSASSAAERFVVVESPAFQVRAAEQDRLLGAIQAGLRAAGCEVVSASPRSENCTSAVCWTKLAAASTATDILLVTGGYKDLGWSMVFEHRSGATGARVGSERESCEACPFDAMLEKARITAQHMAETDRTEADVVVSQPVTGPSASSNPPAPAATEAESNPLTSMPVTSADEGRPIWPIFLMAGGGAVLAGGIVFMAINGRDTDCSQDSCLRRYQTMTPGLILGGVGLAAVAVGIWQYIAWQPAGTAVSLRLGPGHISLAGGF